MSARTLALLKTEVGTDPLVRGYSGMTNAQVSDDMNLVNRPGKSTVDQLRTYFLLERKNQMFLYGRLLVVSISDVGTDPLGDTISLTLEQKTSALTMLNILNPVSNFSLDLNDSRFDKLLDDLAGGPSGSKVITNPDKTAIQAFSLNTISRGEELTIGAVTEADVEHVRNN